MAFEHLSLASRTDIGRTRPKNEDAIVTLPADGVFVVADGMGGEGDGEVASALACEAVKRALASGKGAEPQWPLALEVACRRIEAALDETSATLLNHARTHNLSGCGTTLVCLVFDPAYPWQAICLHAGDSPAYRLREGQLERLTRDHSFAAAVGVDRQALLPPRMRGMLTRAIGLTPTVMLDRVTVDVRADDLFLLCTDGLSSIVPEIRISRILKRNIPLAARVQELIAAALDANTHDNVSACLVSVGALPTRLGAAHP